MTKKKYKRYSPEFKRHAQYCLVGSDLIVLVLLSAPSSSWQLARAEV